MIHVIGAILSFVAFQECNPLSIRTPFWTRTTRSVAYRGQLGVCAARLRIRNENLHRRVAVWIFRMIAHESYTSTIGRPGRCCLIPFALSQTIKLLRFNLEEVNVTVASGKEVPLAVLLVLVAIDDDRLRSF